MPNAATLVRATRAKVLPSTIVPVSVGGALAWQRTGVFSWGWFALAAAGAAAAHLGANVINDFFDEVSGADTMAREDKASIATGSREMAEGRMTPFGTLALAAALFALALAAGVVLAAARGWGILGFAGAGFALALFYAAPPVAYGYIGRGLGEAGIFVAFGLLPVAGSYYVQAGGLEAAAWWAGVVPGLGTTLALFQHNFLHWRADKAAGKRTPVAVLEPDRALVVTGIGISAVYAALAAQVGVGLFPWWTLLALPTAIPVIGWWQRARADTIVQNCLQLLGAALGASFLTGTWIVISLVIAGARG